MIHTIRTQGARRKHLKAKKGIRRALEYRAFVSDYVNGRIQRSYAKVRTELAAQGFPVEWMASNEKIAELQKEREATQPKPKWWQFWR